MRSLLIFCYFLLFGIVISCGESNEKRQVKTHESVQDDTSAPENTRTILFFGTSLTAGLGLDPQQAYPSLIQQKIDSLGLPYQVVNAGLSGETSAAGKNRLEWVLRQDVDVFVLELGANDGLRGIPIEETRKNLQTIIDTVKEKNPGVVLILAGMQIPPNMGADYTTRFKDMFPQLARENKLILIPFLLENVGGIKDLNQADGIHPTAEGQKILAENVWMVLQPQLSE